MKKKVNNFIILGMVVLLVFVSFNSNDVFSSSTDASSKVLPVEKASNKWEVTVSMKGIQENGIRRTDDKGINEAGFIAESYAMGIVSPRDAASGLPTGRRMHKPFAIIKELDKSTPLLLKVFTSDGTIPEVTITSRNLVSKDTVTIKLTDAKIVDFISTYGEENSNKMVDEISLTYKKIEITFTDGKGVAITSVIEVK